MTTVNGPVDITAPRTAMARSNPAIVPKKTRQLNNVNSVVLSLHSRGMTTRDIESTSKRCTALRCRRELIPIVTEVVVELVAFSVWVVVRVGVVGELDWEGVERFSKGIGFVSLISSLGADVADGQIQQLERGGVRWE